MVACRVRQFSDNRGEIHPVGEFAKNRHMLRIFYIYEDLAMNFLASKKFVFGTLPFGSRNVSINIDIPNTCRGYGEVGHR